jgi:hypothetical protein
MSSPCEQALPKHCRGQSAQSDGVQIRDRNGVWEVKVDGVFRGDYHQKEHAIAAAEALRLSHR